MRIFLVIVVLLFGGSGQMKPQAAIPQSDVLSKYFQFEDSSPLSHLLTYFPPLFIQHGIELKSFIRSKTFTKIRRAYSDLKAVDAVFIHAMNITHDNTAVSLLLSAIACFDHRIVGLKIPIFVLYFPLSDESEIDFNQRVDNLPKNIYSDTPLIRSGDRDKLQHFFGSAFITFIFESRHPAQRFSDFIEEGEDAIIVDGTLDERDMRANRQGQEFGLSLLKNNHKLPSEYFYTGLVSPSHDTVRYSNRGINGKIDSTHSSGIK